MLTISDVAREIWRLRDAKKRALQIADLRSREIVELRAHTERLRAELRSGID